MFWSSGKKQQWPPKYTKPTNICWYLNFKSNHVKRGLILTLHNIASTTHHEQQICSMKLVTWNVILSKLVIPKVSLTQLLIPRVTVIRVKRKGLWALCISYMWKVFQKSSNICRIYMTLGRSSKLNTLLVDNSRKPGWKGTRNRWHSASIAFPVNVAEATLEKQADL
jgi:hypothetical protein